MELVIVQYIVPVILAINYQLICFFKDELVWAAAWLYKASGDSSYLNYVSTNEGWSQAASEFSWDNKFAGAQTLLAKASKLNTTINCNFN